MHFFVSGNINIFPNFLFSVITYWNVFNVWHTFLFYRRSINCRQNKHGSFHCINCFNFYLEIRTELSIYSDALSISSDGEAWINSYFNERGNASCQTYQAK